MATQEPDLGIDLRPDELVELLVADVSLARAFYSGIPTARLLARLRLASDEGDLDSPPPSKPAVSSWDQLVTALLSGSEQAIDRVKRAIARHARAVSDEGALTGTEPTVAALVLAVAAGTDADASPAEAFPAGVDVAQDLARGCAAYDPRLLSADRRAPLFEACVRLAMIKAVGPWPRDRVVEAARRLRTSELQIDVLRRSSATLLPLDLEPEVPRAARRMLLLERGELDAMVTRDPRELASAIARIERTEGNSLYLDQLLADLAKLLAASGAPRSALVLATVHPQLPVEELAPPSVPSVRPVSWMPTNWAAPDAASILAEALERGATTLPRLRGILARGGDPALDAIGAEMLRVADHPFASTAFAEVLARTGRTRDVMRLVTYFAVAPDPARAAAALGVCSSPELPSVLNAWLTSMLPNDGALAPPGEDPATSSAARLNACVAALRPYPHLYGAVRPLLARVTDAPAPASG